MSSTPSTGGWGTAVWQMSRNAALGAAEYMTPVLAESAFAEKGVLTPDEFVAAGDLLVLRCPTWQWQAGDPAKARPYLPAEKQFLLTRNVPCQRRARALGAGADDELALGLDDGDDADEWVATHASHTAQRDDEAPDMLAPVIESVAAVNVGASSSADADLDDFLEVDASAVEADDPSAAADVGGAEHIVRTRTYDLSITYDKYYQCARVWLFGYSEARQPLSQAPRQTRAARAHPRSVGTHRTARCARETRRHWYAQAEVLEDVSADHALKTVTLESHPHITHGAGLHASLHPCKHAEVASLHNPPSPEISRRSRAARHTWTVDVHTQVMHKLCSEMLASGRECRPDQYLFLFLKFISCVIPTIEYDYTISFDGL